MLREVVNSDITLDMGPLPSLLTFHTLSVALLPETQGWVGVCGTPLSTPLLTFLATHSSFSCCCVCFLHFFLNSSLLQGEVGESGLPGARGLPGASGPKVTLKLESAGADKWHKPVLKGLSKARGWRRFSRAWNEPCRQELLLLYEESGQLLAKVIPCCPETGPTQSPIKE